MTAENGLEDWPLIGRAPAIRTMVAALRSGRGVVLAGPAGVGKTRLLDEGAAALGPDVDVLRLTATEVTGQLPFGCLASLLPRGETVRHDRVDLFRVVSRDLAARSRPALIALDDAHLLDAAGMALLHHLVGHRAATVALSVRLPNTAPEPGGATVGVHGPLALQRAEGLEWLEVPALARPELAQLLTAVLGNPVDSRTVAALDRLSGGDLVLLHEIVLEARRSGRLRTSHGLWRLVDPPPVGPRLELLVADRMGSLPRPVRSAAETVAVTEPVDVVLLERVAPGPLVDAERAGLVRVGEEDGRLVVRCTHPLYGEVLRRHVPALRRAELWRQLAVAMLDRPTTPDDELRVATWWLDSSAVRGAGAGVDADLLLRAAGRAAALFDHQLARRLALAAGEARPSAESLRVAAEASLWLGDTDDASALLQRSLALATDDGHRTTIITSLAASQLFGAGRVSVALEILDQGPPSTPAIALRAAAALQVGDVITADNVLGPYEEDGDLVDRAVLLAARTAVDSAAGRPAFAVARCDRLREDGVNDPRWPLVEHLLDSGYRTALLLAGDFDRAAELSMAAYEDAVRRGEPGQQAVAALELGHLRRTVGDLEGAIGMLLEAADILATTPTGFGPSAPAQTLGLLATCRARLGDLAGARDAVARMRTPLLAETDEFGPRMAAGVLAEAEGDYATAQSVSAETAERARRLGEAIIEAKALLTLVQLATVRSRTGVPTLPAWLLPRLSELATAPGAGQLLGWWRDVAHALAEGDPAGMLRTARIVSGAGLRLEAAELAAAAQRRAGLLSRPGLQARAAGLGAGLRGDGFAARTPLLLVAGGRTALTPREREVAMLAAEGLTNPDIAAKLQLSRRTVENHLYRVFAKLGVGDRAGLHTALDDQTR